MTRERAGERNTGATVGDAYRLQSRLGGSRSPVFSGVALVDNRDVTVRLFPGLGNAAIDALRARIDLARRVHHSGIARTLDFGSTSSGIPYLVTEFVKGPALDDWLEQAGIPPVKATLLCIQCACHALLQARMVGLVHMRLWPRNMIVTGLDPSEASSDGGLRASKSLHCKLLDLPLLGPRTRESLEVTCAHFVAPERLPLLTRNHTGPLKEVGDNGLSDSGTIYSLGALMYYLCTGETHFRASRVRDLARAHTEQVLVAPSRINPELSDKLDEVLLRCLEFEPSQRYPDLYALAEAIEDLMLRQANSSGTYPRVRI